ncbi:MAG: hypothetical protein BWY83_02258 [bacterium ADurb.Bin478]|nr:MAG: hypothetical protein BWY83_02258 [bacterium ADurb.Bin478]
MKLEIRPCTKKECGTGLAYLLIGGVGWSLAFFVPDLDRLMPPCLLRTWTGLPCPACGATHCGMFLSRLEFKDAFLANPLFFILYLALAAWGFNSIIGALFGKSSRLVLNQRENDIRRYALAAVLLLNWLFVILQAFLTKPVFSY